MQEKPATIIPAFLFFAAVYGFPLLVDVAPWYEHVVKAALCLHFAVIMVALVVLTMFVHGLMTNNTTCVSNITMSDNRPTLVIATMIADIVMVSLLYATGWFLASAFYAATMVYRAVMGRYLVVLVRRRLGINGS